MKKRILKAKTAWVVDSNSGIWTRYDDVTIIEEVQERTQLFTGPPIQNKIHQDVIISDQKATTDFFANLAKR